MGDYLNFINQFGSNFISDVSFNDYTTLKSSITNTVDDILSFRDIKIGAKDQLILYAMRNLLSRFTPAVILEKRFEEDIEGFVKQVFEAENAKKPKDEQKPFPEKNLAIDYLYKDFKNYSSIFVPDFKIGEFSKNFRDALLLETFKDDDIIEGKCDDKVIEYLAGGYLEVRFSEEFKNMRSAVTSLVVPYFNILKQDASIYDSRNSFEYNYYENKKLLINDIFKLTIIFMDNNVNPRKLTSNSPELDIIHKYVRKDMMLINSTCPKEDIQKIKKVSREMEQSKEDYSKKTAIVMAMIHGLTSIEHLISNTIHDSDFKHNRNKYVLEDTVFDIDRISNNIQRLRYNAEVAVVSEEPTVSVASAPIDPTIVENFEYEIKEGEENDQN